MSWVHHRENKDKSGNDYCFRNPYVCQAKPDISPFSALYRNARVPLDAKKDVKVIPATSINIRKIEAEYLKDQAEKKQTVVATTRSTPTEALLLISAFGPSGISIITATSTDTPGSSAAISRPPLTHTSLLWMGQMALSANRRASCLEADVPGMIQTALTDVVTPLNTTIEALAARIAVCEHKQGSTMEIPAMPERPHTTTGYGDREEQTKDSGAEAETDEEMLEGATENDSRN
uniref:Polyprotein protein n=1 Tax=Solanum tuberosum TaxID=4113 RepID=M1DRW7_SOLTU